MFKLLKVLGAALAVSWLAAFGAVADQGSLCTPTTGTISGLTYAQAVNTALQALVTTNSGTSPPANACTAVPLKGQLWVNTANNPSLLEIYDGTNWQIIGAADSSTFIWSPPVGGGATSLASAATTDLWSVAPSYLTITGTTTISQLAGGSDAVLGTTKFIRFAGALQLTYNATQLILPGAANITTVAGDTAQVIALGGGNVLVFNYIPASGRPAALNNVDNTSDVNKPVSTAQAAAILSAQTTSVGWNPQTSSYTLASTDAGKLVSMNVATANTLTVPPNSTVPFALNTRVDVSEYGAGQTTITAGAGVTIRSVLSKVKLNSQYSGATLFKVGTNEWLLFGDLL